MSPYAHYRHLFLSDKGKYLPYLYPVLMPILTLFAFKIPFHTFEDALRYWLFVGFLQLIVLVLVQKAVYSTAYTKTIRWLIVYTICCLFIYFYLFLEYNFFHFTAKFRHPNMWITALRNSLNIIILLALVESIKSAAERKRIHIDNIALENENAKAQYNLLLQQINPHFLFNCFTVLQAMVRSKDARTEAFIVKLADVYQQSLKTDRGTVTLQEELEFFNAYMYLMTLRQEEAIFVAVQVSDESLAYHLPAFSLQLLAENCIKHNIVSEAKPLTIRLYQKDLKSLTISNNYQPKAVKSESFGIGIKNLKKRYALEGISQGIQIEENETNYSTTIKLF
jgi:two-component system, LytTR family, sensor kinase